MIDLNKLKGRDAVELTDRMRQLLFQWAERGGWPMAAPSGRGLSQRLKPRFNAKSWREHWRIANGAHFFAGVQNLDETATELRLRFGADSVNVLIERAERIARGQIDLMGLRGLELGAAIDWHLEPLSGKRSGMAHWSRIDELDTEDTGDKKIVWELNRCQHFVDLGRAYVLTRDERFAEIFAAQLTSWLDQNPPKFGVNWVSSLELAYRAIAWIWSLHLFRESPNLSPDLLWRALGSLYVHGRHIERYLSTFSSPNTHLTGEALGLFYLGVALPQFRRARRWRDTGASILNSAVKKHVRTDGVYFEQSTYYHRYTTDFYTHFLILSELNGLDFKDETRQRLSALLEHLLYIARPDGTTPLIGDDDGGRLLSLDARPCDDFRAALSNGALLLKNGEFKFGAGDLAEETLWLFGAAGAREFDKMAASRPAQNSCAFVESGIYVIRDGWGPAATSLVIDCGPHGDLTGAHGHADVLSFDLSLRGHAVLVDPGTYTYTGSAEDRDLFRSTSAHNTLTIDGLPSATPAGPFSWKTKATGTQLQWIERDRFEFFSGQHDGYASLPSPATHTRSILFLRDDYLIMRDQVAAEGQHHYALNFHGAAGLLCKQREEGVSWSEGDRATAPLLDLLSFGGGAWRVTEDYVSRCHLSREPAAVAKYELSSSGGAEIVSFLFPREPGSFPVSVEEEHLHGGTAYSLVGESARDVFLLSGGKLLLHEGLWSDFSWTWARFSASGSLREAVLLGGHDFRVGDEVLLNGNEKLEFARISRVAGQWVIETDKGLITKLAQAAELIEAPIRRPRLEAGFYVRD